MSIIPTRHFALLLLTVSSAAFAEGELVDMKKYWPQPAPGHTLIIRFDSNRFGFYRRAADGFTLQDAWHKHTDPDVPETLIESSTWRYRVNAREGVVEFQDDKPGVRSTPLRRGYEIKWGNMVRVGATIGNDVMFEGATAPFGYQQMRLVARYPTYVINGITFQDVIKIDNVQLVCRGDGSKLGTGPTGPRKCPDVSHSRATYYLGRGLGILKIENAVEDDKPNFVAVEAVRKICRTTSIEAAAYCK